MRRLGALLLFLSLAACTATERWVHRYNVEDPLVGTIVEVASGRTITEAELLARLGEAQYVLLGEAPGNADHVRLSARLVGALAKAEPRLAALALEPLATDAQPAIVEYLRAHPGDAAGLSHLLGGVGPGALEPVQHEPVLAAALAAGAQIVAPDLPVATMRLVLRHGLKALSPVLVERTGLATRLPPPAARSMADALGALACGRVKGRAIEPLVRVRRARDATMADRLVAVSGRGRGVLLAQGSHARTDWGVPWYLDRLQPEARHLSLAFVEVGGSAPPEAFDYLWYTPSARPPGGDPCAAVRRTGLLETLAR